MLGGFNNPDVDVVYRGSPPPNYNSGGINLKASITTFPRTLYTGSITTATERGCNFSKL